MPDNTPPALRAWLGRPGKYLYMGAVAFFVEIDEKKVVHQLTIPGLQRDGVLEPSGWADNEITQNARVFRLVEDFTELKE